MIRKRLGDLLKEANLLTDEALERALRIPHMDLEKHFIDPEITKLVSEDLARRHLLVPVKIDRGKIVAAMADPLNIFAVDDVKIETGMGIAGGAVPFYSLPSFPVGPWGGDIKLMEALGFTLGIKFILLLMFLSFLLGAVVSIGFYY